MNLIKYGFFICLFFCFAGLEVCAQFCFQLGQTPSSAFPVCGTNTFTQTTVPICSNDIVPVPCTGTNVIFYDRNPYWYKFTCFTSGSLGLIITPATLSDDYDWQLFDITGRNPNDVFTDASLFVACNWSGEGGVTGASNAGTSMVVCDGFGQPLFSRMPILTAGRNYLLLISHFTNSQSGYTLQFTGGTAGITDPTLPRLQSARSNCDATKIIVTMNKKLKCNSLAADGSDFQLSSPIAGIISASGFGCNNGFDMDSVELTLNNPLPQGSYSVLVKIGSDANTLLDNCDRSVSVSSSVSFNVSATQPTIMDSLVPIMCSPSELRLVFKRPILCSSISPDGSDFVLSGSQPVSVISAAGACNNGVTTEIYLQLSSTIQNAGNFQVQLTAGNDGNTLIDECGLQSPLGNLSFSTFDSVSAQFYYSIRLGCSMDTVYFTHGGGNNIYQWQWLIGNTSSSMQNPVIILPATGQYPVKLSVYNGGCSDSDSIFLSLDNEVKAAFTILPEVCPEDFVTIQNNSTGSIDTWDWSFGNGLSSDLESPLAFQYPNTGLDNYYQVRLIATSNIIGCSVTATKTVKALGNCIIAVPSGFTPNGDGLNDYLYPLNTLKAESLDFKVYNRWGQLIFHSTNGARKWDGKVNGVTQNPGVYIWMLSYMHKDTGKKHFLKGSTMLIR